MMRTLQDAGRIVVRAVPLAAALALLTAAACTGCGERLAYDWSQGDVLRYSVESRITMDTPFPAGPLWVRTGKKGKKAGLKINGVKQYEVIESNESGEAVVRVTAEKYSTKDFGTHKLIRQVDYVMPYATFTKLVTGTGHVKKIAFEKAEGVTRDFFFYALENPYEDVRLELSSEKVRPGEEWEASVNQVISFPGDRGAAAARGTITYSLTRTGFWNERRAAMGKLDALLSVEYPEPDAGGGKTTASIETVGTFVFLTDEGRVAEMHTSGDTMYSIPKSPKAGGANDGSAAEFSFSKKTSMKLLMDH